MEIVIVIASLNLIFKIYERFVGPKRTSLRKKLEVLKIVAKHECFGKFKDDVGQFDEWISEFLNLKGYNTLLIEHSKNDEGKNIIVEDRKTKQKAYVLCMLSDPKKWDVNIEKIEAQKLVGAMFADGIKKGIIITTAGLSDRVYDYARQIKERGLQLDLIDGDALVSELYDLRERHTEELLKA
jgi:Restriction endonuclease